MSELHQKGEDSSPSTSVEPPKFGEFTFESVESERLDEFIRQQAFPYEVYRKESPPQVVRCSLIEGWSAQKIGRRLEEVKKQYLNWDDISAELKEYFLSFEEDNEKSLACCFYEVLASRGASLETLLGCAQESGTLNTQGILDFYDMRRAASEYTFAKESPKRGELLSRFAHHFAEYEKWMYESDGWYKYVRDAEQLEWQSGISNFDEIRKVYLDGIERFPEESRLRLSFASFLIKSDWRHADEALDEIGTAMRHISSYPHSIRSVCPDEMGIAMMRYIGNGSLQKPILAQAHAAWGDALFLKNHCRSVDAFRHQYHATILDPYSADIHLRFAASLRLARCYSAAIVECRKAIDLDPYRVSGWFKLRNALLEVGDFKGVIKAAKDQQRWLDPDFNYNFHLALAYAMLGDPNKTLAELRKLKKLNKAHGVKPEDTFNAAKDTVLSMWMTANNEAVRRLIFSDDDPWLNLA